MPRILLAEDDDSLRGFLARALERAGYEVRSCADGDEALIALDDGDWDLLLTDIVMPGTDGIEVARQAAARSGRLRIMFITGFAAVALAAGRGAGAVQARAPARDRRRGRTDDGRRGLICGVPPSVDQPLSPDSSLAIRPWARASASASSARRRSPASWRARTASSLSIRAASSGDGAATA